MKAYFVEFTIGGGFEQECLVVAESEEDAKSHLLNNYLGIDNNSFKFELINERIIIETDLTF